MDTKWLQKDIIIKQEEPVDYYLISSLSSGTLDVALDAYANGDNFDVNPLATVKLETNEVEHTEHFESHNDDDNGQLDPPESDSEASEYEPDSEYAVENDTDDDDWTMGEKRKPAKKVNKKQTKPVDSNFSEISIVDSSKGLTFEGPPYACNICPLTFPLKKSLKVHHTIHKGRNFQCKKCKKVFATRSAVVEHLKIHRKPEHSCPICLKTFALKKSFLRHQSVHEEKKLKCEICFKAFRQKGHVQEHMKIHRERVKRFQCELCHMAYYEKRTLNRHMKFGHSNAKRKRYRCPNSLCDKSYSSVSSFRMHACVDGRRPQDMLNTLCSLCDKRFFNKYELRRHMQRQHVTKPDNYHCSACDRTFLCRYWDSFVLHVAQKCPTTLTFVCDYCGSTIQSKMKMIKHFVDRHNFNCTAKVNPCPHCPKLFSTKFSLDCHVKKRHTKPKCAYCKKVFSTKSGYSLHQKHCMPKKTFDAYSNLAANVDETTIASTIESHSCDICKCSFITKPNLLEHITKVHHSENGVESKVDLSQRTVTAEKLLSKHPCTTCNQTFKNAASLSKHRKRMHKSKRHFKCQTCRITFIGEKLYHKHFKNGDCVLKQMQRYQCTICARIFTRNSNLRRHYKQMHSNDNEYFQCDICNQKFANKQSIIKHLRQGDHRTSWKCEFCLGNFKHRSAFMVHSAHCKLKRFEVVIV